MFSDYEIIRRTTLKDKGQAEPAREAILTEKTAICIHHGQVSA